MLCFEQAVGLDCMVLGFRLGFRVILGLFGERAGLGVRVGLWLSLVGV